MIYNLISELFGILKVCRVLSLVYMPSLFWVTFVIVRLYARISKQIWFSIMKDATFHNCTPHFPNQCFVYNQKSAALRTRSISYVVQAVSLPVMTQQCPPVVSVMIVWRAASVKTVMYTAEQNVFCQKTVAVHTMEWFMM